MHRSIRWGLREDAGCAALFLTETVATERRKDCLHQRSEPVDDGRKTRCSSSPHRGITLAFERQPLNRVERGARTACIEARRR